MKGQTTASIANKAAIFFAFIGIFIGLTLTIADMRNLVPPCAGGGTGCSMVLTSSFAKVGPISVSMIGLAAYIFLAGLGLFRSTLSGSAFRTTATVGFVVSGIGVLASAVYTYLAIGVIGQTCQWCLGSAAVMTLIFLSHSVIQSQPAPEEAGSLDLLGGGAGAIVAAVLTFVGVSGLQKSALDAMAGVNVSKASKENLMPKDKKRIFGNPDAKVVIVEFADPNCPTCRRFGPTMAKIKQAYAGKIAVVYNCFPLFTIPGHETSIDACAALEYAADNGRYEEFHKAIWSDENTETIKSVDGLLSVMKSVGLDVDKFQKMQTQKSGKEFEEMEKILARLGSVMDLGTTQFGIRGTPTFVVLAEGHPAKAAGASELESLLRSEPYASLMR